MLNRLVYKGYEIETWQTEDGHGASIDLGHRIFTLTSDAPSEEIALKEAKSFVNNIVQSHQRAKGKAYANG